MSKTEVAGPEEKLIHWSKSRWLVSEPRWSRNAAKRRRFEQESYFQEAVVEFEQLCSGQSRNVESKSFIIFKPDAAPVRCVAPCMALLAEQGIRPIAAQLFTFDRLMLRELWRYELNIATYARYPAIDALLTHSPSLFVLLESDARDSSLAEFITAFKGPSQVKRRQSHHLRSRIGAGDGVLNHIHTPEETIDVLREIAILFDRPVRRSLLEKLGRPWNSPVAIDDSIESFLGSSERHSLDVGEIRSRFLTKQPALDFDGLVRDAAAATDFDTFRSHLDRMELSASRWDAITLFVAKRPLAVKGVTPILKPRQIVEAAVDDE
jgi:hypothetical protein